MNEANSGLHGLELFQQRAAEVSCVPMDLTMPGMDGARALASMRELCPDVRVVLMSGHSEQELSQRFAKLSLDGLLQKPFRPADLLDRVRQAIAPSMGYS